MRLLINQVKIIVYQMDKYENSIVQNNGFVCVGCGQAAEYWGDHTENHAKECDGLNIIQKVSTKYNFSHGFTIFHDPRPETRLMYSRLLTLTTVEAKLLGLVVVGGLGEVVRGVGVL